MNNDKITVSKEFFEEAMKLMEAQVKRKGEGWHATTRTFVDTTTLRLYDEGVDIRRELLKKMVG